MAVPPSTTTSKVECEAAGMVPGGRRCHARGRGESVGGGAARDDDIGVGVGIGFGENRTQDEQDAPAKRFEVGRLDRRNRNAVPKIQRQRDLEVSRLIVFRLVIRFYCN